MFNSGFRNRRASDGQGAIATQNQYLQKTTPIPTITGWSISGSDDTALNPAGGQTVLVNGTGFATGVSATLGGSQIGAVTLVSSNQISFTSPANAGGSYTLIVYNTNSYAAILVPGLTYSTVPTWTTAAGSIGSFYETTAVSTAVVATSDSAMTYALSSGSLPVGSTLYANGVITGTAPVDSGSTTYTFAVTATDAELQDTTRTFTMTINVDVVTWVTPSSGATISLDGSAYSQALSATDAAGYAVSYTANTLPTGLTLSAGTISGTPTVEGNTSSLLTATSATTNRSATNTVTWVVALSDTYFKYVTLGLSASTSLTTSSFVADNSLNNAQLTVVGDTRAQNFNPYQVGYYSNFFNGSTDYITLGAAYPSSTTTTFTIECWIYMTATPVGTLGSVVGDMNTAGTLNYSSFGPNSGRVLNFYWYPGVGTNCYGTTVLNLNQWYHIAVSVNANTIKMFVNGVAETLSGTTTLSNRNGSTNGTTIANYGTAAYFLGYISNLRIVSGYSLYNANFTPGTTPLLNVPSTSLLTCQNNRFIDGSNNNYALTIGGSTKINTANPFATVYQASTQYYSGSFNGSSDYLSTPATLAAGFGTGDYTVEYWIYATSFSNGPTVFDARGSTSAVSAFSDNYSTSGAPGIYFNTGQLITSSILVSTNTWAHVAFVRSSGTTKVYVNGAQGASVSDTNNYDPTTPRVLNIGVNNTTSGKYFSGYISNLRVTKGLAVYTANFVPATAPLAATQSAGTNTAAITQPSYSVLFNGSSQYLSVATNSSLDMSSGDFTMEGWVYLNGNQSSKYLFGVGTVDGSARSAAVWIGGTQKIEGYFSSDGSTWQAYKIGSSTVTASQWNHIAFVRSGTTFYIFLNGVSEGTQTGTPTTASTGKTGYIGAQASNYYLNGYISNARITKGQALYTTTFTPATGPLTTTSQGATAANVSLLTCQSTTIIDNSLNLWSITNTGTATVASPNPFATGSVTLLTTQSPTFVDSSYNSLAITAATTTVKPLAQSPFTPVYYSNYFGSSSDYLTVPSNAVYAFGTGDFTIEAWVYLTTYNASFGSQIFGGHNYGVGADMLFVINTTGKLFLQIGNSGVGAITSTSSVSLNTWTHVAIVRSSGTVTPYINGTSAGGAASYTTSVASTINPGIGSSTNGNSAMSLRGYISNLRVVKGQALYTTTFTPSTTPLTLTSQGATAGNVSLLTCQSPYFIDTSNNSFAIAILGSPRIAGIAPFTQPGGYSATAVTTYGSGYFDGTGDYLNAPSGGIFGFGTGDYTAECWIYLSVLGTYRRIWWFSDDNDNTNVNASNQIQFGGASQTAITGSTLSANTWYHVAYVRSSGSGKLYLNGVQVGSTTANSYNSSARSFYIGATNTGADPWSGYIADLRLIKGTALYTSAFVPSFTTPLTAITGTQLLTLQTRGAHNNSDFIDQSSFNNLVTRYGNSTNGTFDPYGNNFSNYFDGNGDFLTLTGSTFTTSGDFTVECWAFVLLAQSGNYGGIFSMRDSGTTAGIAINILNTGYLDFGAYPGGGYTATATPYNQWFHVAMVRSGSGSNNIKCFVNGTQVGTITGTSPTSTNSGAAIIGRYYVNGTSQYFLNGYVSNLRYLVGTALYSANFTPSTSPLTAVTNTQLLTCQSNRFIDNSVNNLTITKNGDVSVQKFSPFSTVTVSAYYSGYFDGNGDYLSVPSNSAFAIATSTTPFTVEAWIYPTAAGGAIFCDQYTASDTIPISVHLSNGSVVDNTGGQVLTLAYYNGSSWTNCAMANTNVTLNQWQHVAAVFTGSTCKLFIAGADVTKSSSPTPATTWGITNDNGSAWLIGRRWDTSASPYFTGYISNFRFTKGQALYTSAFTPSTTPLTTTSQSATASNVVLLTCQSNTFIDNSLNYFAITGYADAKPLAVSPFTPTASSAVSYTPTTFGGSMYFDGTGDYVSAPTTAVGTNSFTYEAWIYPTATGQKGILSSYVQLASPGDHGILLQVNGSNQISAVIQVSNASTLTLTNSATVTLNAWTHAAVTRSGTACTLWVNGISVATGTYSGSLTETTVVAGTIYISPSSLYFTGYITDARVTNGAALYTANFYPGPTPATPTYTIGTTTYSSNLLLSGATGGVIDYSRTVDLETVADAKVTPFSPYNGSYYSNYLGGSANYLRVSTTANAAFGFGTGDFTIEGWFYGTTDNSTDFMIDFRGAVATAPAIFVYTSNQLALYYNGSIVYQPTSLTFTFNTWNHVALVRASGVTKFYLNGVGAATTYTDTNNYPSAACIIGTDALAGGSSYWTGYMSNIRIVKGQALYTTNFTPSTSPLTTTSQGISTGTVSLLTCQSNRFVDNGPSAFTITATGAPTVQTLNPFALNSGISYYFDGTGDYLSIPTSKQIELGSADWTFETWVFPVGVSAQQSILYLNANSSGYAAFNLQIQSGALNLWLSSTGSAWSLQQNTIGTITAGVWTYIAVTKSSTTMKVYINGTQAGTNYAVAQSLMTTYTLNQIGVYNTSSYLLNGNLSDLRLTQGYVRYSGNFTPPTTPYKTN